MKETDNGIVVKIDRERTGRKITAMRMANGMTRADLAEKIGRSEQTVLAIEQGHKGMSLETLCNICNALSVTPNYILGWSRYPLESNEEYSRVCEEIAEMIRPCNANQLKTIEGIVRLYADDIRKK